MRFTVLSILAFLFTGLAASPAPKGYVVHEKRDAAPRHWVKRSRIEQKALLPMRIGLTQRNLDRAEELLLEVSDPSSPKYGMHYTMDQVVDLFAPAKEAAEAIVSWLVSAGIPAERVSQSTNKQWIQFDAEAHEAERLLNTEYFSWEHTPTGKVHIACDEYHIPNEIRHHVDYVTPGLKLLASAKVTGENTKAKRKLHNSRPGMVKSIARPAANTKQDSTKANPLFNCDHLITPPCIFALYNLTKPTKAAKGNELGIFEEGDYYIAQDLAEYFNAEARKINLTTKPILEGIDGGFAPGMGQNSAIRSDLDLEISYPLIYPQQEILFQTDDIFYATGVNNSTGFLNTFLDAIDGSYCTSTKFHEPGDSPIDPKYPDPNPAGYQGQLQCGRYKPTNVISIAYSNAEADFPIHYIRRQCAEFLKLGLQGVSVVLAAGDFGVQSARNANETNSCLGSDGKVFSPVFPASCPYLTTVGASHLPSGADPRKDEEVAANSFSPGGGFSNTFHRPKYQQPIVRHYFRKHNPGHKYYTVLFNNNPDSTVTHGGIYNHRGRGYPDVAAIGDSVLSVVDGSPVLIGSTGASTSVFAAILNRINEERLAAGKKIIGFINPVLYQNTDMFHDIVKGSNPGCNSTGFSSAPGWDPVTGLGTPDYPTMLKVFMGLP